MPKPSIRQDFAQTNATGRVFGNDAVVSVAAGATLDISNINMEIGGLAVD